MAEMKRTKKHQKAKEAQLKLLIIITGFLTYFITNSISASVYAVIITLIVYVVMSVNKNIRYQNRLKAAQIDEIDSMDGVQFEQYLRVLFQSIGYSVQMTASTGDFGADLLLKKDGQKIVVQAKRYSKSVGIKAVQEVISSVKMYQATEAWVITNSSFTKAAIDLANANEVRLIEREELVQMINQVNPIQKPNAIAIKRIVKQQTKVKCEKCGSEMVIRKSRKGIFYGCSDYPRCNFTKLAK
jgi:restriction system protein